MKRQNSPVRLGRSKREKLTNVILEVVLLIVGAFYLYPVFLVCINSVKLPQEMAQSITAMPKDVQWVNYASVFQDISYLMLLRNTILVTVVGVIGVIVISSLAAYILNRRRTHYTKTLRAILIAPILIPFHAFMVMLLKVMVNLHLAGSVWGLGIQYWGFCTPMAIFIYYNFMDTIPKEMDESAKMDGASNLYSFFHVIFPLLRPVTVTVLVLDIMWIWNDLILPLLMVNTNVATRTLTLGVYSYIGHFVTNWDYALCAMVMSVGPSIVIFILLQKYIVDGVVAGAIKG